MKKQLPCGPTCIGTLVAVMDQTEGPYLKDPQTRDLSLQKNICSQSHSSSRSGEIILQTPWCWGLGLAEAQLFLGFFSKKANPFQAELS